MPAEATLPGWFTSESNWYVWYAVTWNVVYYALAIVAGVAPIVAWFFSGGRGSPPVPGTTQMEDPKNQQRGPLEQTGTGANTGNLPIWKWVGFWSALAAACTTVNTTLTPGSRAEAGFEAHQYLDAVGDWFLGTYLEPLTQEESHQAESVLRRAKAKAAEIFYRKPTPQFEPASATESQKKQPQNKAQ